MSRQPWEWTEEDILAIVTANEPETLSLEYKAAGAIAKSERKKTEISKDVSAMANSAGGTIIYGIDEQKACNGPLKVDAVDQKEFTTEWLEQVIDSSIQRRVPNIRVNAVVMSNSEPRGVVYVVFIPQSNLAPHMATDHRYYKRLETTTALMDEYEVRDVGRRSESPDLHVTFKVIPDNDQQAVVLLLPYIENYSVEPAFYAGCKLFVQRGRSADVQRTSMMLAWSADGTASLVWNGTEVTEFLVYRLFWGIPDCKPLIEGETYQVGRIRLPLSGELRTVLRVGYGVRYVGRR